MESVMNSLKAIGNQFLSGIPNLLTALFIFFVGMIIAKMITKALKKVLSKIGIDKLGDKLNEIDMVSKANMDIKLSEVFTKVIYYVLMLFVAVAASDALGMPAVSNLVADIFNFIPNLIVALIILILGLLLCEAVKNIVKTTLTSLGIASANLISNILFYFLFLNIVVSALTQAKINTEFLSQNLTMIIGGAVLAFGIGYGLAAKDIIANFLASFYSKDKVKLGDRITLGNVTGEVIGFDKSCIIVSTADSKVIIPLSRLTKENLEILK